MDPLRPPLLAVQDLACERSERSLFQGLSFALHPGELLLVQGGNGRGKTSLLRLLAGLGRPQAGEVRWRGERVDRCREVYHREMAYLAHANGIKEELDAVENLRFNDGLNGRPFDVRQAVATLERLGLSRSLDRPCRVLSFGQRRRVALAALLRAQAALWILDEPLTGLDVHAVALVETLIREHLQAGGIAVATTHQALNLGDVRPLRLQVGEAAPAPAAPAEAI